MKIWACLILCIFGIVVGVGGSVFADRPKPDMPLIHFSTADSEDPLPVGGSTMFELVAENQGTRAATNVLVIVQASPHLKIDGSQCTKGRCAGVIYTVDRIAPKEKVTLRVFGTAISPGAAKLSSSLKYAEYEREIVDEEGVSVYE